MINLNLCSWLLLVLVSMTYHDELRLNQRLSLLDGTRHQVLQVVQVLVTEP